LSHCRPGRPAACWKITHTTALEAAEVTTTISDITGRPPGDIGQFARDYAWAFSG